MAAAAVGGLWAHRERMRLEHEEPAMTTSAVWLGRLTPMIVTGAALAGMAGPGWSWHHSAVLAVAGATGPAIASTDAMWQRITLRCNRTAAAMSAVLVGVDWAVNGTAGRLVWAATCAAAAAGGFALAAQAGMTGGGDVRAAGWCSALVAWAAGPIAAGMMLIGASGTTAGWALITDRQHKPWYRRRGPFGPGFVASTVAVAVLASL